MSKAASSEELRKVLAGTKVDLIILDINMPGMDGFQTLAELRKVDDGAGIPVIFLSSLDRQYLKVKGLEGGADDYLTKPFGSTKLIETIKRQLDDGQ